MAMVNPNLVARAGMPSSQRSHQHQHPQQLQQHQNQQPQRRQDPEGNPVRCNKCRIPLSATVFKLSCNCILCEECTFSHFKTNSNCPSCNRTMKDESDIKELMISRPPTLAKLKESIYKRIFVKSSPSSKTLNMDDLWNRIQRQSAMHREGTKFVLQQFLKENNAQTRRSSQIQHALQALKEDQSALKRELNRQKEVTEGYKQELIIAGQKIEEKDRQLAQFRKMFESRTPHSSGSIYSGGGDSHGGQQQQQHQYQYQHQHQQHHHGGATAGRESYSGGGVAPARPRRVSDQHLPPPSVNSRHSRNHGQHGHRPPPSQPLNPPRTSNPYQQDRGNPYEQSLGGGTRNVILPPVTNPYSKSSSPPQAQSYSRSHSHSQSQSQENHYRHRNSQHINTAAAQLQNPYQTQPAQAQNMARTMAMTQSQPRRNHPPPHSSYQSGRSGGSVASRRSHDSGSTSGGRIRHITANTGYHFTSSSGSAGGGSHGRKRPLSPSQGYASNSYRNGQRGPSGYHQQSY